MVSQAYQPAKVLPSPFIALLAKLALQIMRLLMACDISDNLSRWRIYGERLKQFFFLLKLLMRT